MGSPPELSLAFLTLRLVAKGKPALWLALPVAVLVLALAWRILR